MIKKIKSRAGQDLIYKLGSKKTRKELSWKPIYSLKSGLQKVLVYHSKYFKKISKKDLIYQDKQLRK